MSWVKNTKDIRTMKQDGSLAMDEKKERAIQAAFEKGMEARRQDKSINENPYSNAAEEAAWVQGWEQEEAAIND